jgi:hypothetical protein
LEDALRAAGIGLLEFAQAGQAVRHRLVFDQRLRGEVAEFDRGRGHPQGTERPAAVQEQFIPQDETTALDVVTAGVELDVTRGIVWVEEDGAPREQGRTDEAGQDPSLLPGHRALDGKQPGQVLAADGVIHIRFDFVRELFIAVEDDERDVLRP